MPLHTTRESRPTAWCVSRRREEAVQGKGQASLCRPTSILERTRRCTPHGRSPGGPACPEDSGRIGHQRPPPAGDYDGMVEYWNGGILGKAAGPPTHRSNIPLFHYSNPPVLFRRWAALQGFPPTQGLPEIFHANGTDGSEADASREEKGTTRHCPEPPLLLWVGLGGP